LIWSARILGTLGVLFAILCASCIPRPLALSPLRTLSGGLFLALAAPLAVWAIGGLEQGFLSGMLAGAFVALARLTPDVPWSPRSCLVAGGFLGAVVLLRADGIVLALGATGGYALAGKLRLAVLARAALVLSVPVGLLGLQLLFRSTYYGALVPNTALAKVAFNLDRMLGGLYYVRDGYRPLLPALALTFALVVVGFRRMRLERTVPPLLVLVGWSSYLVLVGGDIFPGWRQLVPAVVALGMLLAEAAAAASARLRFGVPIVLGVAIPVLAFGLYFQTLDRENLRAKRELWEHDGRPLGRLLHAAFGAKKPLLAVDAAGALPFWSELPCLDLLGLNDRYIATHPPPSFGRGGIGHELGDGAYALRRRPDIVAFNGSTGARTPMFLSGRQMLNVPAFQQEYQLVRARGSRGRSIGEFWMRREGGKVGLRRDEDRIDVPGYFFASGHAVAELDNKKRLVANAPGSLWAELPRLTLPEGTWELLLDTNATPAGVAFRCDGVSAAETGVSKWSIEIDTERSIDVVVGAGANATLAIRNATFVRSKAAAGFRCPSPRDRLIVPLSQLARRKAAESDWAGFGNVIVQKEGIRVELPQPSHAPAIELSVDGNDRYAVLFALGSQVEGSATVGKSKKGGLLVERVEVPQPARSAGFDRVEIVPLEGDGYYSVGHAVLLPN
ncbi:MAG TPA: hypothetical protein VMS65_14325, partial [Polyangiaceae bacterium]|nr:hypothetical protein [Polyangiaceae bacterium]